MVRIISSPQELESVAQELLKFANSRQKMAFYAEIGAGKTTLIQSICNLLHVKEKVTSPTFSLVNEYHTNSALEGAGQKVFHIDLYRLNNIQEALDIGIEDYLYEPAYTFIEWPELVESILPEDIVRIKIEILENSNRKILFL